MTAVRKSDQSLIGAFLPDFISNILHVIDGKNDLPVPICPLRELLLGPANFD